MIAYTVTADVESSRADPYRSYMRGKHIAEVLATKCFTGAEFQQATATRFQTRYLAISRTDLDRYLALHAAALRDDFDEHFPEGVSLSRDVWEMIEAWSQ